MAQHDAKEAHNMRLFIQSLHDATYQHRFEYVLNFNYTYPWVRENVLIMLI